MVLFFEVFFVFLKGLCMVIVTDQMMIAIVSDEAGLQSSEGVYPDATLGDLGYVEVEYANLIERLSMKYEIPAEELCDLLDLTPETKISSLAPILTRRINNQTSK